MTELEKIYAEYDAAEDKGGSALNLFRGWFGLGGVNEKRDGEFLEKVKELLIDLAKDGKRDEAFSAASFILEHAATAEDSDKGRCKAAVSGFICELVPLFDSGQKADLSAMLEKLPRRYMLDNQMRLKKLLEQ